MTYRNLIPALSFGVRFKPHRLWNRSFKETTQMATRDRRLAEFNGNGDPPEDRAVEVLCEDQSGTYKLPFACRWVDGEWRNSESGSTVQATVVGWRLPRA
jgi:hypothetical protein